MFYANSSRRDAAAGSFCFYDIESNQKKQVYVGVSGGFFFGLGQGFTPKQIGILYIFNEETADKWTFS